MVRFIIACVLSLSTLVGWAQDTYDFKNRCPQEGEAAKNNFLTNPYYRDGRGFPICQCTSYVAHKLNWFWGSGSPQFSNSYYSTRWGNAYEWYNAAKNSEVGITGASDNFTWEPNPPRYNAVYRGDVAYWKKSDSRPDGHVAFVEDAQQDAPGKGVKCVKFSEYNVIPYDFGQTADWVCKGSSGFPDYFLHVDKDRSYCLDNQDVGSCKTLIAGKKVADGPGSKYGGLGGGGSDTFNLRINSFGVWNSSGVKLTPATAKVTSGQVVTVKVQVKAKDGNTSTHMRPGKSRIEVDIYVQENLGDWTFLKREYIQAVNLPSGATHTESVTYIIPQGVSEVSFKAKIDAEDEAYEANEGDNWTEIQTFQIDYSWLIPIINLILED